MSGRVTLKDIAQEAGLSIAAASHALNGSPRVSESTRQRVIEISKNLGYQPRGRGKARKRRTTDKAISSIRLVLLGGAANSRYIQRWTLALTRVIQEHEMRLELGQVDLASSKWEEDLRYNSRGTEGMLVHGYITEEMAEALEKLDVPVVTLGDAASTQKCPRYRVSFGAQEMGYFATSVLLAAGHRRIGFFRPESSPRGWFDYWQCGYQQALSHSDVGYDPGACRVFEKGVSRYQLGVKAAEYMTSLDDPPTAYIVPEISRAASFRQAMEGRGVTLDPESLIVGGESVLLGDHGLEEFPSLEENVEDGAEHAVRWLLRLSRGETTPGELIVPFRQINFDRLMRRGASDLKAR